MSNPNREVRSITDEVRMIDVDGRNVITGYAAVFNSLSQEMTTPSGRKFRETIKPGAFARSLESSDVRGLFNHDTNQLLGRRGAGTLRLIEDERGLRYEIDPAETTVGKDVVISLKRGDLTGSSFSFATVEDEWGAGPDGSVVRELRSVHVFDVGPVVFPAYLEASAAYRSLDRHLGSIAPKLETPSPWQVRALTRLRLVEI